VRVAAVIAAAGLGRRMEQDIPKTYLHLAGKPILIHTLEVFEKVPEVHEVLVVVHPDDLEFCQREVIDPYPLKKVLRLVPGGKERQDSVYHALKILKRKRRPWISSWSTMACGPWWIRP
jgi:2-C-methyl-D-erythritol 4-phosphate cytidylyltransferase